MKTIKNVFIVLAAIAFASTSLLVQAAQITPNPNPSGSTLDISNDPFAVNAANPFTNTGTINIDLLSTLTNQTAGTLLNQGTLTNNGVLINNGGLQNNNSGATLTNAGTLTNNGNITNTGTMTSNGTLTNYGILTLAGQQINNGTLTNYGSVSVFNSILVNNGVLTNTASGSMYSSAGVLNTGLFTNDGTFAQKFSLRNNGGTLINTGLISDPEGVYIQTAGKTINNGIIQQLSVAIDGGILRGTGTITSTSLPMTIGGGATLSPGTATTFGTLTINGTLQSSGNLVFRIAPLTGQYDVLKINGNALFTGGTMSFTFLNTPKIGDSWNFLYVNSITGWNTLNFLFSGLGAGETAQFSYINGVETVKIVSMPEPNSLLLTGLGLGGLALWRRLKGV